MLSLQGSRTEANLKRAFSDEAQSNRQCLAYAQAAEARGFRDFAATLRATADDKAGYAVGHLDYLVAGYDPAAAGPAGKTANEAAAAMLAMTDEQTAMYAGMARSAHEEGFEEIADWFLTLAKTGRSHTRNFRHVLDGLRQERETLTVGFGE
jgi:rubrerythrin